LKAFRTTVSYVVPSTASFVSHHYAYSATSAITGTNVVSTPVQPIRIEMTGREIVEKEPNRTDGGQEETTNDPRLRPVSGKVSHGRNAIGESIVSW
jgi:hypothetical protein